MQSKKHDPKNLNNMWTTIVNGVLTLANSIFQWKTKTDQTPVQKEIQNARTELEKKNQNDDSDIDAAGNSERLRRDNKQTRPGV